MGIFLPSKKDIDSKTILHENLSNVHIALRNMHIAQVCILRSTDTGQVSAPLLSVVVG
jgi:hypothetical protein